MGTNAVKKNLSSIQVLKTLQVLLEDNYTMNELIEKLNANESEPIFNNSVVSKYINTCRFCGVEIPKIHNRYFVSSLPFGMDLSSNDLNLFEILQNTAKSILTIKNKAIFDSFITKLSKYSNKKIIKVEKNNINFVLESFEKAIEEKRYVKLMFRTKKVLEGIPLCVTENKGRTFLNIKHNGKEKLFSTERLTGFEISTKRFIKNYTGTTVVYKLTGDLATRYNIKENETLLEIGFDYKRISCREDNKEVLFARLMRYDSFCEIEKPKNYREEMKMIIQQTLANYGE